MKTKFYLASALIMFCTLPVWGQSIVTSGLQLHLDATVGFNSNGTLPATWNDQSGSNNHLTTVSDISDPVVTTNAAGTPFTGIYFDGVDDYMFNVLSNNFNSTSATLFVVRIGNTFLNTISQGFGYVATTLSIASPGSYSQEFVQFGDWALHHYSSGNWVRRTHQCYSQLPDTLPAITASILNTGTTSADLTYYVNGVLSTDAIATTSNPLSYTAINRSIILGARYWSSFVVQGSTYFPGYILEVLAYNRALSTVEADSVNNYLKCKYAVNYTACNSPIVCAPLPLHLLTFNAKTNKNDGVLNWQVAPPKEKIKYSLQRSDDGKSFQNIYEVVSDKQDHSFTDYNVGATHTKAYYRLASADAAHDISYSRTVLLDFANKDEIIIFPNVMQSSEYVNIHTTGKFENMQVMLCDITGRMLKTERFNTSVGGQQYSFSMDGSAPAGVYVLKIIADNKISYHKIEVQ